MRLLESSHIDDIPVDILYPDACRLIVGCGDSSYLTLTVPTDTNDKGVVESALL